MVQQVILERDAELAALAAAVAAAEAGHGTLVLVEGPAGIGKTTLLRAACRGPGARVLTARGLGPDATAALVRRRLGALPGALVGDRGDAQLGRDWHASTGGNPFLLEALATALRDGDQKAEPIAQAVLRRIGPEGPEGRRLARALAVLGGPAPLRQAAALAGLDLPAAARLADRLRAADVLAPGAVLEFAHPIVRTAVYESIPPGERALAHAEAARLLERDGADAERLALHLLRSEPGGDPRVAALLRAAATAATGRGAPGAAAACLRRALDEPPPAADRPGLLLELGIALARERSPAAVPALREAVELAGPDAALLAARVLGIWAYHAEAAAICRDALAGPVPDELADSLQAELFQNAVISAETVEEAVTLARRTGRSPAWGVNDALLAATSAAGDVTV